jgi:hypothetical protein
MADALAAVQADAEAGTGSVEVELVTAGGKGIVHVLPVNKWKASVVRAMRAGDFDVWAEKALDGTDYADVWTKLDPDMDEITELFAAWNQASGQDSGKSSASSRSSKTTARR